VAELTPRLKRAQGPGRSNLSNGFRYQFRWLIGVFSNNSPLRRQQGKLVGSEGLDAASLWHRIWPFRQGRRVKKAA
jgi:hypothetical protein